MMGPATSPAVRVGGTSRFPQAPFHRFRFADRRLHRRHVDTSTLEFAVRVAVLIYRAMAAPARDDTAWLRARLDAGGTIVLPKLPNGQCYATRGLWVSHDDTAIKSDGACLVALGRGEARLETRSGKPMYANAVFFVSTASPCSATR
jgi:hypothetical protein